MVPVVGAALLVGLLPATALAIPPVPTTGQVGREDTLELEELPKDVPVPGDEQDNNLESMRVDIPRPFLQPPVNSTTAPPAATGTLTFAAPATPAAHRSGTPPESGSGTTGVQRAVHRAAGTPPTEDVNTASVSADPPPPTPVQNVPVSLGRATGQPAPTGTWQVSVADRVAPLAAGVDGAVITVQAPATGSVPLSVRLDYAKFRNLHGADWASRLRFVQFPECYLTTPAEEACQEYETLETVNDTAAKAITATVDTAADGTGAPVLPAAAGSGTGVTTTPYRTVAAAATGDKTVIGAVDSGAGPGGSFKATPLPSAGKWEAGGASGAFTWSYPVEVPDPPAGPTPNIALGYNSQSVDGRTAIASPQASWVGDGWDYDPGHIERRYRTCEDDRKPLRPGTADPGTPNNTAKKDKTSDLCWVSHNAVMSLGGKTTELVRDDSLTSNPETATEVYRPASDDGTRVERRTGATNGDDNGEYWVVTTADGTVHYYGLHNVGGGHADTDSVSTVPVFGNHPGEPCHASTFAASRCGAGKQQAWRWGLDKVVDVHGNAMVIDWQQATNHYSVRKKFKTPEVYDRAAYPNHIEYGMRSSDLTKPSAKVDFVVAERCLASPTACAPAKFDQTGDPGAYRPWWDTPGNLNCKATSDLCPAFPSFWSRIRLSAITTYGQRPGATTLQKVDTHTLQQSFPHGWYSSSPGLWLDSITRKGFAPGDTTGTDQSADGVSFSPYVVSSDSPKQLRWLRDRHLPNLVPRSKTDQRPEFTRPRIGVVATDLGGEISVEYRGGCATEPAQDRGRDNTGCYPVRWSPDGEVEKPAKAWFNKYVVESVTERDSVTAKGGIVHRRYEYDEPAWAPSDDEFLPEKLRTHSAWRGYRQVTVFKGGKQSSTAVTQSQSKSLTRYFLGTGGTLKDTSGTHTLGTDSHQFAGMTAEAVTYRSGTGSVVRRVLSFPWTKTTAERSRRADDGTPMSALRAHRTGVERTEAIHTTDNGIQSVRTLTTVDDTHGLPVEVETAVVKPASGGGESLSNRTCTRTSYVHNTAEGIIGLPKETRTTGTSCAGFATASPATELKGSVRTSYDGLAYGATPTKGRPTTVSEINGEGTDHSVTSTFTYDPLGRPRKVTKPLLGTVETQYTPGDTGGPVTSIKTVNAKGHTSTTTYDPARSLPLTTTDANGRTTRTEYDALGRLVKGWSAARSSGTQNPDVQISYHAAVATSEKNSPAAVTVRSLKDDGSYSRHITLYDGLARPVQTQAQAHGPGRIITDTNYNDHGLPYERTSGYLAQGEPVTDVFQPKSDTVVPSKVKFRYDGLERVLRESVYHAGQFKYATYTSYSLNSTIVYPPGDSTPTVRTTRDVLDRVTSVRHYTSADEKTARTTSYTYDARGNRDKVTDPDGNAWTFTHDARGRVTATSDPDTGDTTTQYDEADRPSLVVDAGQRKTHTEYDILGRAVKIRHGTPTSDPVKEFTFDPAGALGHPASSIRHTANGDYVDRVTGYDADYRPTGRETVIPANPMTTGLSGTYTYGYAYTPTGKLHSVTLPGKGGLATEKVVTRYNEDGLPETTSGLNWYTADTTYSPFGEVLRTVSGSQPDRLWTTNFIDEYSGRLQRTVTDRETAGPHRVSDGYYSYDVTGSVTSHARQLRDAAGSTWDNQCFTHDRMRQVVHAWTSNLVPDGKRTGCRAANGANWGYDSKGAPSTGPVAEAVGKPVDSTPPGTTLPTSLSAAAPAAGTVSTGATAYRQSFTFDLLGNRATMTEHDPANAANNVTQTYHYGKQVPGNGTAPAQTVQPHTLTSISRSSGGGSTYAYDVHGNTRTRTLPDTTQQLDWTQENKLDSVTDTVAGTTTRYVYDASGNRLLENSSTGSTLYLGETELTTNATGTITRASRTYAHPGAPSVVRTTNNGSTTAHIRSALITDHLGTANTTVELTGNQPVTRRAAKPYGETRGPQPTTWPNKRGFLGVGIDDKTTGLTHIGAREYDQSTGRFISADPIIDFADPLQMNGYAYANNSPVSMSDPTGLYAGHCVTIQCMNGTGGQHTAGGTVTEGGGSGHCVTTQCTIQTTGSSGSNGGGGSSRGSSGSASQSSSGSGTGGYHGTAHYGQHQAATVASAPPKKKSFLDRALSIGEGAVKFTVEMVVPDVETIKKCPTDFSPMNCVKAVVEVAPIPAAKGAKAIAKLLKGAKGCRKCFLAGTAVLLASGATEDIEDIEVGDRVLATDPETGETGPRKVTALIRTQGEKFLNELSIATEDGIRKLTATHDHPFWSPSEDAWLEAHQLEPGMTLRTDEGDTVIVTGNREYTRHARTYNLTVEGLHSYYVLAGSTPVLVHNSSLCGTAALEGGDWGHIVDRHRPGGALVDDEAGIFIGKEKKVRQRIIDTINRGTPKANTPDPVTGAPRPGQIYEWDFGASIGKAGPENGGGDLTSVRVIVNDGKVVTAFPF
ncbi:polymorphic toxin-type HINT domain-containing protein [Streptomyces sp. JNUCC 64]